MDAVTKLTALTRTLQERLSLEEMLQRVVDTAAELTGASRASVRLLDASGTRLLPASRFGQPLHGHAAHEFQIGQGLIGWIAEHREPLLLDDAETDSRYLPRADIKEAMHAFVGVPLMSTGHCVGVLSAVTAGKGAFTSHHLDVLTLLAAMSAPYVEIARLYRLSQVDPLTGALNRRGLELAFPESESVLSIILADVDHFKRINDEHGHAAGDEVLRAVASVLGSAVRESDAVVRLGGEEFLLVLPGLGLTKAARIAERARESVVELRVSSSSGEIPVTISLGVSQRRAGEKRDETIARADAAMYAAKQGGRNRVELETAVTSA